MSDEVQRDAERIVPTPVREMSEVEFTAAMHERCGYPASEDEECPPPAYTRQRLYSAEEYRAKAQQVVDLQASLCEMAGQLSLLRAIEQAAKEWHQAYTAWTGCDWVDKDKAKSLLRDLEIAEAHLRQLVGEQG